MTESAPKAGLRAVCDPATGEVKVEPSSVHPDESPGDSESEIGGERWRQAGREILREHGEPLRRELARYRRKRIILRLSLELASRADSFCQHVNDSEGLGHDEVGELLRAYLHAKCSPDQVCQAVNEHLQEPSRHVVWELRPLRRPPKIGKKGWPQFELDKDGGATDAWRDFAQLLGHGASLRRFRYCLYEPCQQLFFDRSPRGDKTCCTAKHKHAVASRTYRRKGLLPPTIRKSRARAPR